MSGQNIIYMAILVREIYDEISMGLIQDIQQKYPLLGSKERESRIRTAIVSVVTKGQVIDIKSSLTITKVSGDVLKLFEDNLPTKYRPRGKRYIGDMSLNPTSGKDDDK